MSNKVNQYDAQMVADWFNGSNFVHSSIANNKQIKELEKFIKIWNKLEGKCQN